MTQIVKTKSILELDETRGETVVFANGETQVETDLVVAMTLEKWEDLGRPGVITATIEPGDQLNTDS